MPTPTIADPEAGREREGGREGERERGREGGRERKAGIQDTTRPYFHLRSLVEIQQALNEKRVIIGKPSLFSHTQHTVNTCRCTCSCTVVVILCELCCANLWWLQ